ncbi:MarR family winged helix-turn-helix transcriptional regulator [Actinoplanes sp. DH11]|uniref:MarR family winged helix-turn-helix transcriptional regulator n=1 Tax=Actinoplanes sp. DH11 TaxID=2857011 RepID=UPI001E4681DA|nr:MarR family transcriptional regulator [Actinoplanes sp. DH11]
MANEALVAGLHELLKAVRLLKQSSAAPVSTTGVLAAIRRNEACHMKDLAAEHALDPSTISRTIAALVRDGLVARTADPADGRASMLRLTDRGRTELDAVYAHYDSRLADALARWSQEEIDTFAASLQRFAADLIAQQNQNHTPSLEVAR